MLNTLFLLANLVQQIDLSPLPHNRSIIQPNSLEKVTEIQNTEWYPLSLSVARVESSGAGFCTAFRVGEKLFMTNQHCSTFKPCSEIIFNLGFDPTVSVQEQVKLHCKSLHLMEKKFDVAIFEVKENLSRIDYPVVNLFDGTLFAEQAAFFASYAGTFSKSIDRSDQCRIVNPSPELKKERETISHGCDSMSGSSGAPVFDKKLHHVIALHWGGILPEVPYNQAIRMKDILDFIRTKHASTYSMLSVVH